MIFRFGGEKKREKREEREERKEKRKKETRREEGFSSHSQSVPNVCSVVLRRERRR